jgi:glycosyltransferase involved in cell wall biosynthesis
LRPALSKGGSKRLLRIAMIVPAHVEFPSAPYGDIAAAVTRVSDGLTAAGHHVALIDVHTAASIERVASIGDQTFPELLRDALPEVVHMLKVRRAVKRLATSSGVDIVHDHTFVGPLIADFCQTIGLPAVTTVHGRIDSDVADHFRAAGKEVSLVAVGDLQRQLVPDLNWVGQVHNAIDVADWPFQAAKDDYVLFLGRCSPGNVPHLAVRAAHEAGVRIVMAGECAGPVEKTYFRDRVFPFLDADDSLFGQPDAAARKRLLAGARCLLMPIESEDPSATAMTEALACGTPVVTLNRGSVNDVVVDGVTGILCNHPDDLADGIHRSRKVDPRACRRHVARNFNAQKVAASYVTIYQHVLNRANKNGNTYRAKPATASASA